MSRCLPSFAKPNAVRSKNMQAIRSRGNLSTEWSLRSLFIRNGIRGWKLHCKDFLGVPDFAFPNLRVLIFIDGCFWHGCPRCGHIPKTNHAYWKEKIRRNSQRDQRYSRELRLQGFKVIRIWECSLKKAPQRSLNRILMALD